MEIMTFTRAEYESACDEMEEYRKRIAELEAALKPFALAAEYYVLDDENDLNPIHKMGRASRAIEVGALRRARAALQNKGGE